MEIDFNITGQEQVKRVFEALPRVMQSKIYNRALMSGGGIVKRAAIQNVKSIVSSEASGVGARNVVVNRLKKARGWYRAAVRIRKGAVNARKRDGDGKPVRVGLYMSVLEYGKKNQPPRSWIRKAIREEKEAAVSEMTMQFRKRLSDAVREAGGA